MPWYTIGDKSNEDIGYLVVNYNGKSQMDAISPPEWVRKQLINGENIISRLYVGASVYYATNCRLLMFPDKVKYTALDYDELSITLRRYGIGINILRVLLIILSVVLILSSVFGSGDPINPAAVDRWGYYTLKIPIPIAVLLDILAVFIIFFVLYFGNRYYQIYSSELNKRDLKKWRIPRKGWRNQKVDTFAKIIAERSGTDID